MDQPISKHCNFFAFWSYVNPWKLVRNGHSNLTFHWWLFACVECARQQAVLGMDTPKIADSSRLVVGTAISYFRWFVQKPHQLSVTTWSSTSGPFSKVSYTIKVDCVKFWKATDQKKKKLARADHCLRPATLTKVPKIMVGVSNFRSFWSNPCFRSEHSTCQTVLNFSEAWFCCPGAWFCCAEEQ